MKKLKQKFKNLHRHERAEKAGIILPIKRTSEELSSVVDQSDSDVYDRHNTKMLSEYLSGKWSYNSFSTLMEETFHRRRIYLKSHPVVEAIEHFPWLKEPSLVSS